MAGYYAGVDLGGTKIAAGILDAAAGTLIAQAVIPTEAQQGPDAVMQRTADLLQRLAQQAGVTLDGAGMGVPAVVDYERGRTLLMPNLPGWYGLPVAAQMTARLNAPVTLLNDARAFTLAEATLRRPQGARVVACFTVGTGIGGGLAIEGRLHMGLDGAAGEFGHQTIVPDGPTCGCGNRGCLEMLASGTAITTAALRAIDDGSGVNILRAAGGDRAAVSPEVVLQAVLAGDTVAARLLYQAATYLGIGVSNVVTLFAPDCVVIGGGVARLGDWLLNPVREAMLKRCTCTQVDRVTLTLAAAGPDAGVLGAALWAAQQLA
ncbi:MAG: ROK family protein [Anaerolineae bacterium]|jgi:glucokinase|nr:ROK family protein [Anaerolineae bacterium]